MAKKDKGVQGQPAASNPSRPTLGMDYPVYVLGDVAVEVVGTPSVFPMQPDEGAWTTAELPINTPVQMINGQTWRVARPPNTLADGRVQVQLKWATRPQVGFIVPADSLDVPLWNTGQPRPVPVEEPPPVIIEGPVDEPAPEMPQFPGGGPKPPGLG